MATEAKENRIFDILIAQLNAIGPVGATWNTDPSPVQLGVPGEAVAESSVSKHQLYAYIARVDPSPVEEMTRHAMEVAIHVWCVCTDTSTQTSAQRGCLNLKRDVLYAFYNNNGGEGAYVTLAPVPRPGRFEMVDGLTRAGVCKGVQEFLFTIYQDHTDP
jgi:hypothetical protein